MFKLFGVLILAFLFTGILLVPFINFLYRISFRYKRVRNTAQNETTLSTLHENKIGTPTGGGFLIIVSAVLFTLIFYALTEYAINWTAVVFLTTLILFGGLGLYDDARKMVRIHGRRIKAFPRIPKLILQITSATIIGYLLYDQLHLSTVNLPILNSLFNVNGIEFGLLYIPFAVAVILGTSNAFNITDGLDGLSTGLLLISLCAFWYLASNNSYSGDVMLFIAVMIGTLLAFLYFNIYPARLFMGDTGSMALGAMLAVVALVANQALVLPVIGGVFVIEFLSSALQILSKRFRNGKKVFQIAPIHFHFQAIGWDETKVTMRFWLAGAILAFVGVFLASITF